MSKNFFKNSYPAFQEFKDLKKNDPNNIFTSKQFIRLFD